jgi:hypothetical protein
MLFPCEMSQIHFSDLMIKSLSEGHISMRVRRLSGSASEGRRGSSSKGRTPTKYGLGFTPFSKEGEQVPIGEEHERTSGSARVGFMV